MKRTRHGLSHLPEYKIWKGIRKRCFNKQAQNYQYYGGRGITICDGFSSAEHFINTVGKRPTPKHTLDRIDNEGHYSCGSCEHCKSKGWSLNLAWRTHQENCRNTRSANMITFKGETHCIREWVEITGVTSLSYRLQSGWPVEKALTTPVDGIANQPNKLPDALHKQIIEQYQNGLSIAQIADIIDYNHMAVAKVLRKHKIPIRSAQEQKSITQAMQWSLLTHNDQCHSISKWSELTGIPPGILFMRIRQGWSAEKALTTPG